jgi:hypothetical protein
VARDPLRSAFDPREDPVRFEHLVAAIVRDAMAARGAALVEREGLLETLAGWGRPALLAAAASFLIALPTLLSLRPHPPAPAQTAVPAWETLGVPQPLGALLTAEEPPTVSQLSAALHANGQP